MSYNWLECWEKGCIPFHLNKVNPLLKKYWPGLSIAPGAHILVPLCGKTQDLLWLAEQGLQVIGVELSPLACEAFFIENELEFNAQVVGNFTRYYSSQIELFCGDLFALSADMLPVITAIYDRAALIAFSETLRRNYAQHLIQLIAPAGQMLLIVYDSKKTMQGPPHPVSYPEITQLFGENFKIKEQERIYQTCQLAQHLRDQGYNEIYEVVYSLKSLSQE